MDRIARKFGMSPARAVAILAICGGMLSSQAWAQLSPVPGSLTVTITSPTSGARVGGTITVTASVSVLGSLSIAGVQFKLDGIDLGAEDTTPPYSVSWDASNASDGWHTLTAVARETILLRFSSDPVTVRVANADPPPAVAKRYEETDAAVSYSLGWRQRDPDWFAWSGGSAMQSPMPGAQATFTFTGTSVTWIGYRSGVSGIARVLVDGVFVSDVDLFARSDEIRVPALTVTGLTDSRHTLTIEVTGLKNKEAVFSLVVVDAFDVPAPVLSRLQDTDPDVSYSAGWAGGDASKSWSGPFATVATMPGAQAALTFTGTAISWVGYRGPDAGTARVYLDGLFAGEVDMYAPTQKVQDIVFTAQGLADAGHTLVIEATGLRNAASTGTLVVVDAFDVISPGIRFQEMDWAVTYSGDWWHGNLNKTWSEGTAAGSEAPGAQATFAFSGTSVSWIGCRKSTTGIARVYLDGTFVTEIDTFAPAPMEGYQNTILTLAGLADGRHTLTIEATGQKNPAAASAYVVVDAFDVRP